MGNSKSAVLFEKRNHRGFNLTEERKRMDLYTLDNVKEMALFARVFTALQPDRFTVTEIARAEACYLWDMMAESNDMTEVSIRASTGDVSELAKKKFLIMFANDVENEQAVKPNVQKLADIWGTERLKKRPRPDDCNCECACSK